VGRGPSPTRPNDRKGRNEGRKERHKARVRGARATATKKEKKGRKRPPSGKRGSREKRFAKKGTVRALRPGTLGVRTGDVLVEKSQKMVVRRGATRKAKKRIVARETGQQRGSGAGEASTGGGEGGPLSKRSLYG